MWSCSACTYLNQDSAATCEVCRGTSTSTSICINNSTNTCMSSSTGVTSLISLLDDDDEKDHIVTQRLTSDEVILSKSCPQCTLLMHTSCSTCEACDFHFPHITSSSHINMPSTLLSDDSSEADKPRPHPIITTKRKSEDGESMTSKTSPRACIATNGLIPALRTCLLAQKHGTQFALCSDTLFISQKQREFGDAEKWSCGYRNVQMLLSSLKLSPHYPRSKYPLLWEVDTQTVLAVQQGVERAWSNGFDVAGAKAQLWSLVGTSKWLGAVECCALLRYFGLSTHIVDFDRDELGGSCVSPLCDWVVRYFDASGTGGTCVSGGGTPLYLQYQGHSVTIVGYERRMDKLSLLLFDPAKQADRLQTALVDGRNWQDLVKLNPSKLNRPQYQIVYVEPNSSTPGAVDKILRGEKPSRTDFSVMAVHA